MAKNYTIAEAVEIIAKGKDFDSITDLSKRYPLLTIKLALMIAKAPEETVDFFSYMPDYLSANKVNKAIKDAIGGDGVEEVEVVDDEVEEAPKKKAAPKKAVKKETPATDVEIPDSFEGMNNAKMYKLLGDLGERKACKEEFGDLSKASMLSYLNKYHGKGEVATDDSDDDWGDEDEASTADEYEGKTAPELYKLCKSRKIKAAAKKTAKYYADLLRKADAEAEATEDDTDDDWGDDEELEVEEVPKKAPAKKAAKKAPAKKAVKKAEPVDDDDDDDWDI